MSVLALWLNRAVELEFWTGATLLFSIYFSDFGHREENQYQTCSKENKDSETVTVYSQSNSQLQDSNTSAAKDPEAENSHEVKGNFFE